VSNACDDSATIHRADDEAGEIAAEHQTGQTWPEAGGSDTQRDERSEESVCQLDGAGRKDERSDLRAHSPIPIVRRQAYRTHINLAML
jgi:hypothetical protein